MKRPACNPAAGDGKHDGVAAVTGASAAVVDAAPVDTPSARAASAAAIPSVPSATAATTPIDVAVGILMAPNGDVLLAQRPEGKPYAGYWEFPGGKVERGEDILAALKREFVEELGIHIQTAHAWCGVEHVYPHAHVRLHFYISHEWSGQPQSLEGQAFAWQGQVNVDPLLPATIPLIEWLDALRVDSAGGPSRPGA